MIISLTGFMGCGKSSVGRRLSELLCCRFADLDTVIEERAGSPIPEIFASCGETEFRRMELEALSDIIGQRHPQMVLALGGGAVMTPRCETLVHEKTLCIYLRTSAEELVARLSGETSGRPLLASTEDSGISAKVDALRTRILTLMALRSTTYERTAHIIIDTDNKSIDRIAQEIIAAI